MTKTGTNVTLRGRSYYYRASYSSNRKTFAIRLSLETASPVVARERAARIDLALKERWRQVTMDEVGTGIGLSGAEKKAIMVAHALQCRRNFADLDAAYSARAYADPSGRQEEYVRGLRCLDVVHRDIAINGINRPFETQAYEDHVLRGWPECNDEERRTLRGVARGASELVDEVTGLARQWLADLDRAETSVNVAAAVRQLALGALVAIKEEIGRAEDPGAALDAFLNDNVLPSGSLEDLFGVDDEPREEASPTAHVPPAVTRMEPNAGPVAAAAASVQVVPEAGPGMTIHGAADAFLAAHPRYDDDSALSVWTPKTRSQFEAAVFLAAKHFGDTPVAALGEVEIANFVRTLRRLPANHHKTPAHAPLTLIEIAERGAGPTLGGPTINRHVRFIKLVLDWAWKRQPTPPSIDWRAFIEIDRRLKRDKRPAFTADELRVLFSGAVWHGFESRVRRLKPGSHIEWDGSYWVPILLAYTGARREEIAKLQIADVALIDGIWCVRLQETSAGRLKNAASERDIPLADEVLRLGFLAFVDRQRDAGEVQLFPDLRLAAGSYGDVYYKKHWRALERAGLVPAGKDIHSIRHYASTALATVGVSEERRADLLGHTLTSQTAGTYTKRTPLDLLQEVVNLLPIVTGKIAPLSG